MLSIRGSCLKDADRAMETMPPQDRVSLGHMIGTTRVNEITFISQLPDRLTPSDAVRLPKLRVNGRNANHRSRLLASIR